MVDQDDPNQDSLSLAKKGKENIGVKPPYLSILAAQTQQKSSVFSGYLWSPTEGPHQANAGTWTNRGFPVAKDGKALEDRPISKMAVCLEKRNSSCYHLETSAQGKHGDPKRATEKK